MYGLLTKREVKMAGYWPSSFFACLWTETKSRSINTQKKNEAINLVPRAFPLKVGGAPHPPSRERPWERGCEAIIQPS